MNILLRLASHKCHGNIRQSILNLIIKISWLLHVVAYARCNCPIKNNDVARNLLTIVLLKKNVSKAKYAVKVANVLEWGGEEVIEK